MENTTKMENQKEIKGLVFLKSYYESIQELENEDKLEMYNAIFELAFFNQSPTFSKKYLGAIFKVMEPNIQNSLDRYKASQENGKKGGRPSKSTGIKLTDIPKHKTPTKMEDNIEEIINTPIIKEEIKEIDDLIEVDDDNDYFKELIKPKNKPVELPIKKKSSIDLDFYINNLQTIQQ
jgi:hypothetical protein